MYKLVVLFTVLAVAAAKPGYLHGTAHIAAPAVAVPASVSHQSRTDVIHEGVIATYAAAPVVAAPVVSAPVLTAHAAPIAVAHAAPAVAVPGAVSHQSRTDFINPVVTTYAAATPVIAGPSVIAQPHLFAHSAPFLAHGHLGLAHLGYAGGFGDLHSAKLASHLAHGIPY